MNLEVFGTRGRRRLLALAQASLAICAFPIALTAADAIPAPGTRLPPAAGDRVITAAEVTVERVGTSIPVSAIGEPVGGVTLSPPRWIEATGNSVAHALVEGAIAPRDPNGKPINFRVLLPASWSRRAIQVGGGGMNGMVPMFRGERPGSPTASFARYGSDSGHQMGGIGRGRGGGGDDWALNEEAIRNLGYLQMKKTHDAAMVIMERVSTNPDLSAFYRRGGKMIVTIGTDDTLASPGAQLDYFQSVLDKMGRDQVDAFARFFVLPQTGHGLSGRSSGTNGDGQSVPSFEIPSRIDRTALIVGWVERNEAPGKTLVVTAGGRRLPLCSYPNYPRYKGGPPESAESYESAAP